MSSLAILLSRPLNKGGKGGGGKGNGGNYPSTTGNPSGPGRGNGPRK